MSGVFFQDLEQARTLVDRVLNGDNPRGNDIPGWDGHAAVRVVDALVGRYGLF